MIKVVILIVLTTTMGFFFFEERGQWLRESESRWLSNYPIASTGPLRGVLVASWWIEIQNLQQRYEFEKIAHISKRICYLQPNIPEVWDYMAWNLGYNLLAETSGDREQQLYWLKEAVELINEGLKYNPKKGKLHFYLGLAIYQKYKSDDFDFKKEMKVMLGKEPIERAYECFVASIEDEPGEIFKNQKFFNFFRHDMRVQLAVETKRIKVAWEYLNKLEKLYPKKIDRINELRQYIINRYGRDYKQYK